MKKNYFIALTAFLMGMTSCGVIGSDDDADDGNRLIIEPPYLPMFQFGEDGVPYRTDNPTLSADVQLLLSKEFVGYGWKWMQSNELGADGFVKHEGVYDELIGGSPSSFYVESDSMFFEYFYSDALNKYCYWHYKYEMDPTTGSMTNGSRLYYRIWTIYTLSGKWFLSSVEPLFSRVDGDGVSRTVWGVSQYVRMTEQELKQMQRIYNYPR